MKWRIKNFESSVDAKFTDGLDMINVVREGYGQCWRLSTTLGFLDIIDAGDKLYFNNKGLKVSSKEDLVDLHLKLKSDKKFSISYEDKKVTDDLKPQPILNQTFIDTLQEMYSKALLPYNKVIDAPGKSIEEIALLGKQYFPHRLESFFLALTIYDWTTADFDRMVLLTEFCYTALKGRPLDIESLTDAIWSSNWAPYTPRDSDFMASFLMKPADSREAVLSQLQNVSTQLYHYVQTETRILATALTCLPPTSTLLVPKLYSGQVDISNLGMEHFAPGFFEFPLNAAPSFPLSMPLDQALDTFIKPGCTLTSKKIISFTDEIENAMHYQNGILLIAEPSSSQLLWDNAAFVTNLSDNPNKNEYTFMAGSKFLIKNIENKVIDEREMIVITIKPIGCLKPDLVASNEPIVVNATSLFTQNTLFSQANMNATENITIDDFILIDNESDQIDLKKRGCSIS